MKKSFTEAPHTHHSYQFMTFAVIVASCMAKLSPAFRTDKKYSPGVKI